MNKRRKLEEYHRKRKETEAILGLNLDETAKFQMRNLSSSKSPQSSLSQIGQIEMTE